MKRMAAVLATLVASSPALAAGPVTVKGSDTMVILVQRWAEEFMKMNPAIKVQVTGGGSGTGIAALINGTTQIATASRPMKDAEKSKLKEQAKVDAVEVAVAKDGVTFYVNESNPLNALTMDDLRKIYRGDVKSWKEVGGKDEPIVLYSRENSSGTYVFVKEHLLKNEDYAPEAQTLPGTAAVVNAVAKEAKGIGYGGAAYAKGVKELKVKTGDEEVSPTEANIKSGKYPMSRPLFFYTRGEATGDIRTFIDYALSKAGQETVTKVGYFSIN
jgi:phosphate transport system substrate-binding protein